MEVAKGFRDFSGEEALKREKIREMLVQKFKLYGFEPVETPSIEYENFVKGDSQDEAVSDIFKLQDKGKRKLALRYELTFQLKRLAQNKKLPFRRYQIGEVFRDEPVTSNRFRQFTQCDIDAIGSTIKDEAEILALSSSVLSFLKIKNIIYFNNRKLLNEILDREKIKEKEKVIREIDKIGKIPESEIKNSLKRYNAEKILILFKKPESFFKKYSFYKEIEELKKYCKLYKINIKFSPSLARGLSYYNGAIFEIKSPKMKETIMGGGSYLINGIQSTGISFGLERISQLAKLQLENKKVLLLSIAEDAKTIKLAEELRKNNIPCFIMYGKPSKALDYANQSRIPYVIFIGKEELKKKKYKLRDMKTGREKLLTLKQLVKFFK